MLTGLLKVTGIFDKFLGILEIKKPVEQEQIMKNYLIYPPAWTVEWKQPCRFTKVFGLRFSKGCQNTTGIWR